MITYNVWCITIRIKTFIFPALASLQSIYCLKVKVWVHTKSSIYNLSRRITIEQRRGVHIPACTIMHLYMKGTAQGISAIHPSGSFELSIYPRVYGCQATNASPLALVITNSVCNCIIMVQVSCTIIRAGIHITALRVQIPYTLETHGTTITNAAASVTYK